MTIHEYIDYVEKTKTSKHRLYHKGTEEFYDINKLECESGYWYLIDKKNCSWDLREFEIPKTPGQELDDLLETRITRTEMALWRNKHKDLLDK